ncbi:hypothetical protein [Sulfurimonas sp.]|uniref:hypothetical protein n=1 Tax=Sulfurimonas sp. TaxID=2022749 RepID=UPI002AB2AC11|nr:hypothetical protein [Sulfurimonas sp.]
MKSFMNFLQEIGSIMYVGGILSHIIIGANFGHLDPQTAYTVAMYKEISAYILILPGLGLKIFSDIYLYYSYDVKPNYMKVKFVLITFLSINAFFFLVPMMPELVTLAKESVEAGEFTQTFLDRSHTEGLIGMSNAIPLVLEIILTSFKPKIFGK